MAKPKFDGVVEVVRYNPDGNIAWVRAYLRRGATFSDRVLIDRQTLIQDLKAGKRYVAGKRQEFMASTFDVAGPIEVRQVSGNDILVAGDGNAVKDHLEGVPII